MSSSRYSEARFDVMSFYPHPLSVVETLLYPALDSQTQIERHGLTVEFRVALNLRAKSTTDV